MCVKNWSLQPMNVCKELELATTLMQWMKTSLVRLCVYLDPQEPSNMKITNFQGVRAIHITQCQTNTRMQCSEYQYSTTNPCDNRSRIVDLPWCNESKQNWFAWVCICAPKNKPKWNNYSQGARAIQLIQCQANTRGAMFRRSTQKQRIHMTIGLGLESKSVSLLCRLIIMSNTTSNKYRRVWCLPRPRLTTAV